MLWLFKVGKGRFRQSGFALVASVQLRNVPFGFGSLGPLRFVELRFVLLGFVKSWQSRRVQALLCAVGPGTSRQGNAVKVLFVAVR